jgi:hypothetical protein
MYQGFFSLCIVFDLLSADAPQEPKGNQRASESVVCSHTRESRGSALVAYQRPKLDGRLEGLHIYTGHLSKFKSRSNSQICQMGCEREGSKGFTGRFGRGQFCDVRVETLQLRIVGARDQK